MSSLNQNLISTHAFVTCSGGERWLVVIHDDLQFKYRDNDVKTERTAAQLLDAYAAEYLEQVKPHMDIVKNIRNLSLQLKQIQRRPTLP